MTIRDAYADQWDETYREPPERELRCLNCGRMFLEHDLCPCHDPEEDLNSGLV